VGKSPATNTAGFSSLKSSLRPSRRVAPLDRRSVTTASSAAQDQSTAIRSPTTFAQQPWRQRAVLERDWSDAAACDFFIHDHHTRTVNNSLLPSQLVASIGGVTTAQTTNSDDEQHVNRSVLINFKMIYIFSITLYPEHGYKLRSTMDYHSIYIYLSG
jgi:hypothetical protein